MVEALRDALLDREELIGDEILEVIRGSQPGRPASVRPIPTRSVAAAASRWMPPPHPPEQPQPSRPRPAGLMDGRRCRCQPCSAQLLHRPRKTTSTDSTVIP